MSTNSQDEKPSPRQKSIPTGSGIGVGIAIGVALGAAFDNIGLGIALGVALGAAVDWFNRPNQACQSDHHHHEEK